MGKKTSFCSSTKKSYIYIQYHKKATFERLGFFPSGKNKSVTSEAGAVFCIGTFALDIYAGQMVTCCGRFKRGCKVSTKMLGSGQVVELEFCVEKKS